MNARVRAGHMSLPLATLVIAAACSSPQTDDTQGSRADPTTSSTTQSPRPDSSSDTASSSPHVRGDAPAAGGGQGTGCASNSASAERA